MTRLWSAESLRAVAPSSVCLSRVQEPLVLASEWLQRITDEFGDHSLTMVLLRYMRVVLDQELSIICSFLGQRFLV